MVMVPNPAYHRARRFRAGRTAGCFARRSTRRASYVRQHRAVPEARCSERCRAAQKIKMLPLYRDWIARGWVSGELLRRPSGPMSARLTTSSNSTLDCSELDDTRQARRKHTMNPTTGSLTEHPTGPLSPIRCLIFPACRASPTSSPACRARAGRAARRGARNDRRASRPSPTLRPGTTWCSRSSDALDRLRPRLDASRTSQRRRQHARTARSIQRNSAEAHSLLHRARAGRAPVRALPRACCVARSSPPPIRPGAALVDNALRDFRLSGAELAAATKARFKAIEEELANFPRASPTMCSTPPTTLRCHRGRIAPGRHARRRRRSGATLPRQTMASRAGSSPCGCRPTPGDAIRRRSRACARRCTARTRRAPASSAIRNGTTAR